MNQGVWVLLGLFLASSSAFAEVNSLHGRVYTDQYLYTSEAKTVDIPQSSASLWLDWSGKSEKGLGFKVVGQGDFFNGSVTHPNEYSHSLQLREGYVFFSNEGNDLRVGQQIIPWGKSDGINPTDYFTAKNFTLLNPDDEVRRIGAPAFNYSFTPLAGTSPVTLQVVCMAYYPQNSLLISNKLVPTGITFNRNPKTPIAFQSDAMEFGAKFAYQKSDFDFSLSVFKGYTAFPEYIYNANTHSIDAINASETAVGGDASFNFIDSIIRLESALHMPDNGTNTDPLFGLVEPWHWDSVVGIEKPFFEDFRLQLQFLYRWHVYYQDSLNINTGNPVTDSILAGLAKTNATLLNYQQQGNPGATFRMSYAKDTSNWTADLYLIGYFSAGTDFLLRPQLGYSPIEGLKLLTGLDLYGGEPTRTLGSLFSQSDAFFEAKYLF